MKLTKAVLVSVAGLMLASAASAHSMGNKPTFQSFSPQHNVQTSFYGGKNDRFGNNDSYGRYFFDHHRHDKSSGSGGMTNCDPTPEPGTWAMMIVGAGLVGFQLRRKQKDLGSLAV